MNIKDKLAALESFSPKPQQEKKIKKRSQIEQYIEGENLSTLYGTCFVTTNFFNDEHCHGSVNINDTNSFNSDLLAITGNNNELKQLDLSKTLFFDTETTGLSSGTGTHIFLAGFGYFENEQFVIKQFFLNDFDEELAFLQAINELFKNFNGIVSYNGKCFDWPMLQTRFIYSKLKCEMSAPLHLDLVHTARRIWKRRLGDCSLQNIEREVLNFQRTGDIPGFEIPHIYFQYLRDKEPEPLVRIFQHNILDIISLAALLIKSTKIFQNPEEQLNEYPDLFSVAYTFEKMMHWNRSIEIYEYLLENISDRELKNKVAFQLSFCYKRLGNWKQAERLWRAILANGFNKVEVYIELAKYYEHQCRDYEAAVEIVNQALKLIEILDELKGYSEVSCFKDDLYYRLKRITEKKNKIPDN